MRNQALTNVPVFKTLVVYLFPLMCFLWDLAVLWWRPPYAICVFFAVRYESLRRQLPMVQHTSNGKAPGIKYRALCLFGSNRRRFLMTQEMDQ